MSFFSRKKKDDAAAAAAAAPAAAPASFGYPGVVGGSGQQQQPASFAYPQYPAAVAGYQPPAFHNGQGASPSPSPAPYQPSASAYAAPAAGGGSSPYLQQSPPPPLNPHAVSSQPPQPQQQPYGGYAMQGQYLPQQQPQYAQAPQPYQLQQQPPSSQQQPPPPQQQHSVYSNYSRYQQQPSQQPPVSYQFAPAGNSSAQPSQPQYAAAAPQSQLLYQNGYGQQQQQPQPQYAAAYSMQPKAQAAPAPYASSSPQSAADMKPYETAQQAAARLARAEASEQRLDAKGSNGSVGGKQKTWAAYQEIEREEREKQQRIAQRQQQQQQSAAAVSLGSELDVSSPHYHQLNSPAPFPSSQFSPVQFEQPMAHQQPPQQSIPDLLTWDVHAAPVSDSRREDPPTPRAADQQAEQHEQDEDGKDDQKQAVLMAAMQQQQQQPEEEDDDEEDEDDDDARADERKQQQRQQQAAVDEQEGGQEGQSWQQIGKGRRPVDELDSTDSHGEGQTKDEPPVAVTHLIDYAEKQEESLNQPLLSPASAAHARASAAGSDLSLLAPVPHPAVAASSFDFLADHSGSSSNSQPLLASPKAAAAGSAVVQSGGSVTVLAPPKRTKKKKAAQAADVASVAAVNAPLPQLSNASNAYGSHHQQPAPISSQQQQHNHQQWASPPPQQLQQLQPVMPQPPVYQQPHPQQQQQQPQQQQQQQQQAPAASQSVSPPLSAASAAAMSSPYAQRLYAGFAFQLYTDTSTHELFLFYEPHDGPRGTLYWCQPGKREKNSQHSMPIHDITHSVLGKHNFPMVNARAVAAAPIQCFTLYDKQKRLDMAADSGANREEFLQCLENVIKDGHQIQPAVPATVVQQQPQPQQSSAVTAVRSQPVASAVPAQVVSASPNQHQQGAAAAALNSYYAPPPVQQSQPAMAYPMAYPQYPNSFPAQPMQQASYPALQAQQQQQPLQAPFNFQYGVVPGMSRQPASQPLHAQPPVLQLQQSYPAHMQQHQQQQQQLAQALLPPQLVQENPDLIRPTHAGLRCDSCGVSPIKDVRYKCTLCFNFDLCERCERKGKHPKSHPLLKMYACGRSRDVAELFHRAQYKELQQQQLSKRSGLGGGNVLLTEDVRFDAYHKDMLSRVMAQAHTLPPDTMRHLIEILVQLMTATDETREAYAHIRLRDEATQRLLLPFPVALDILRLCGFDYVQAKSSGDNLSFQGMEQFEELYFNPQFKLTVVETVVERLLRL